MAPPYLSLDCSVTFSMTATGPTGTRPDATGWGDPNACFPWSGQGSGWSLRPWLSLEHLRLKHSAICLAEPWYWRAFTEAIC